ncbi:MAG: TatD family hydrolase [Phycisphaerae bacterium]|nr:TatD family hydrolase [Phycisphaerae bacterium]
MKLIDSHAHLTFDEIANSLDDILHRSIGAGVTGWLTIGTDTEHNKKVVSIIDMYENLYGAVGIHPHYASKTTEADIELVKELAKNKKIVAIGETGLDFHYDFSKQNDQINLFEKLLQIAADCSLPVIIHSRDAFDKTMEIIDNFGSKLPKIVFHCWGGTAEQTQIVLDRGFYISFTGVVTFKNAAQTRESAKIVPLERMMLETDCPYMSPEPIRKQKINTPALMIYTAQKIAELKNMPLEKFAHQVTKTTEKFFNLPTN